MKITIESTSKIVELRTQSGRAVPARIWQGETESGVPVHCYITRIAVKEGLEPESYKQFETELQEHRKPTPDIQAIPLAMII